MQPQEKEQRVEITVEQAEKEHPGIGPDDPRYERCPEAHGPFGFLNKEWEALKAQMQPGDKLIEYCSDAMSWAQLAGRHWIELNRDGKQIAAIMCSMN